MTFFLKKLFSKIVFVSVASFFSLSTHAQSSLECVDLKNSVDIPVTGAGEISRYIKASPRPGDVYIFTMTPGTATAASWIIEGAVGREFVILPPVVTVMTGGTLSNTLTYTGTGDEWTIHARVNSINGTATLSLRCISAEDAGPPLGIPTLSQWGLFGTGLLLTLATAFHFRPRRRRPQ